jgi:hypothetical protein
MTFHFYTVEFLFLKTLSFQEKVGKQKGELDDGRKSSFCDLKKVFLGYFYSFSYIMIVFVAWTEQENNND